MFWLLLLILLKNFKNLFIFCINIDIDELLLLDKKKHLGLKSLELFLFVILEKLFYSILLVSAYYLAK